MEVRAPGHNQMVLRGNLHKPLRIALAVPCMPDLGALDLEGIDWVVIGTETGRRSGKVTAHPQWVTRITQQAQARDIPVFMKEELAPIMGEEQMIQELPQPFIFPTV